ncbi:MAG: PAS domain S-box protein [Gemmatimonadales bacterium]|nr:PAS domain S-box protein [Gemmatimonadales bacterium]
MDTGGLALLRRLLEVVEGDRGLDATLAEVALWVERALPACLGSVLLVGEDGAFGGGAGPSLPEAYNRAIEGLRPGECVGSCGTAVVRRTPVIVEDIATDPLWPEPFRSLALRHGLRACWSHPMITADGRVLGTFAVYRLRPATPTEAERRVIEDAARLAKLVIERDRARAEGEAQRARLARQEAQFREMLDNVSDVIAVLDVEGGIRYVSPSTERVFGRTVDERIGRNVFEHIHPDDRAATADELRRRTRDPALGGTFTFRYRAADGAYRTIESTGRAMALEDGTPGIVVNGRDITERLAAERELAESRTMLSRILDATPDTIYRLDLATWRILMVTPAIERLLGVTPDEVLQAGASFLRDRLHPDDAAAVAAHLASWQGQPDQVVRTVDFRLRHANGEWRCLTTRAVVLARDGEGRPAETVGVAQDVTERRSVERRLRETERMEALGRLAGGVAHDFNNLLAVILNHAELARLELAAGTSAAAGNQEILSAARRARDLVRQILAFSRRQEPVREPFALRPLVEESLRFLRSSLPATVELRPLLEGDEAWVEGDAAQLQQVLLNLCTNAEYAMRATGGGVLTVRLGRRALDARSADEWRLPAGTYVDLAVEDTGAGMTPEVLERVFEPFFTTKPVGEGTGMGLAVAHGVLQSHGGAIRVQSAPGRGTRFDMLLPGGGRTGEMPAAVATAAPRGKGRVLVVDDEPMVARATERVLRRLGYSAEVATAGPEALDRVRRDPAFFDLVLTDLTMPRMTGAALARALRELRPGLPIVICTGYSESFGADEARRHGVDAYLAKPIEMRELADTMARLIVPA